MDLMRLKGLSARDNFALREAVLGVLKEHWTSLPAIISEDSDGHVAKATSAVKLHVTLPDGTTQFDQMADFDTCPVKYPGGGGVTHTHPIKKGDEVLIQFAAMAQDLWHQKGGVQEPVDSGRRAHLADGFCIPSVRSDPRKLNPPASTSSQQNRSDDGKHVFDTHPQNGLSAVSASKVVTLISGGGAAGAATFDSGGGASAGTIHLPGKILKNAAQVLINCIKQSPLPDPGSSFANKKAIALLPVGAMSGGASGGGIASIMSSVMSGGASAIFANPTAGAASALSSTIATAIAGVGGGPGSSALNSALTAMNAATNGLSSGASALSGATLPTTGQMGLNDLLNHAQALSQYFGTSPPPAGVELSTATAPLETSATMIAMTAGLNALAAAVNAGTIDYGTAKIQVDTWTGQLNSYVPASTAAITTLQASAPLLDLTLEAANAGISLDPNENAVHAAVTNPNLNQLSALMAAVFALSAAEVAAATAFPDANAAQPGATGGL